MCGVYVVLAGRTRSSDAANRRVIDQATRKRRQKKQLEALESDNFHEDPHNYLAQLSSKAKLPTFAENSDGTSLIISLHECDVADMMVTILSSPFCREKAEKDQI